MVGATIASMVRAAAAITDAAAGRPSTAIMLTATMIAATVDRTAETPTVDLAAVVDLTVAKRMAGLTVVEHPMAAERLMVVEHPMAAESLTAAERLMVVEHLMAAEHPTVVERLMVAAGMITGNQ